MSFHDLVRVATATVGTGTMTLGAAVSGCLTFANGGVVDGEVVCYGIADGANSETGLGTYSSTGPTLSRDTVYQSTNGGSKISLSGSAEVFIPALSHPLNDLEAGKIQVAINGNPGTGVLLDFEIPCDMTIADWTLISTSSISIVIDLWRDTYANFPPTVADTQTGDQKPTLSAQTKVTSSDLSHWTVAWNAGDLVRVNIDSRTIFGANRVLLILSYTRR